MSIRTGSASLAAGRLAHKALTPEAIVLLTAIASFLAFAASEEPIICAAGR